MTILLAEDDIDDQELLAEAFSQIDPAIELHSFSTGKHFLSHVESLPDDELPGLMILDYNIPEINGSEILQHLQKERYRDVVKLVWSTSDSPLYKNTCIESGALAYFVKPSSVTAIKSLAEKMLDCLKNQQVEG